jgi:hypothetical protein
MTNKTKIIVSWVLVGIIVILLGVLIGLSVKWHKENKEQEAIILTKSKVDNNLSNINNLIEKRKETEIVLDSAEKDLLKTIQDYRELLKTNQYEKDSAYIYINNVHIDSILAKLPRLNEEQ